MTGCAAGSEISRRLGETRFASNPRRSSTSVSALVVFVTQGRGRHSGAEVAMPVAHVVRWRNGLAVYAKSYTHQEDALRDLGLSEDELEGIEP
jgi:hypothetical protein